MSSDDKVMSLEDFPLIDSSSESTESGEFKMGSIVRPYTDEPWAHSSDEAQFILIRRAIVEFNSDEFNYLK